jgi:hypothetical protein
MYVELMAIEMVLRRRLQTPDAPICQINTHCFPPDKRARPYTQQEVRKMRDFLKRHAAITYIGLFYRDGPDVFPDYSPLYFPATR